MVDVGLIEQRVARIEQRDQSDKAAQVKIGMKIGGVIIETPRDIEVIAERLARGQVAVPVHCRGQAGTVYALIMQALEWGMPVMSVINKSYVVTNKGVERIAYESQLIHAVILKNAPLVGRLRHRYEGDGDDRRCIVWGTFSGEKSAHEYPSETLGKLRDNRGRNEYGKIKGSPLWDDRPDVQLFYSTVVQWARMHAPDVILGAYTPEELDDGSEVIKDVTPEVERMAQQLRDSKATRGFDPEHVAREAAARSSIIDGDIVPDVKKEEAKNADNESTVEGRSSVGGDQGSNADDKSAGASVGGGASEGGQADARSQAAKIKGQGETFPSDKSPPKSKGKR